MFVSRQLPFTLMGHPHLGVYYLSTPSLPAIFVSKLWYKSKSWYHWTHFNFSWIFRHRFMSSMQRNCQREKPLLWDSRLQDCWVRLWLVITSCPWCMVCYSGTLPVDWIVKRKAIEETLNFDARVRFLSSATKALEQCPNLQLLQVCSSLWKWDADRVCSDKYGRHHLMELLKLTFSYVEMNPREITYVVFIIISVVGPNSVCTLKT